jgi:hypothetical protein
MVRGGRDGWGARGGRAGPPSTSRGGRQGLQVSWLLVAGSTTLCALPRHAAEQQVLGASCDGVVVEHVGGVVVGAGAGDLADQAPPHAHQELLGEGRQGGLAGDPAWPLPRPRGCEGGGWLGLLLPIPWPMCPRAGVSPRS